MNRHYQVEKSIRKCEVHFNLTCLRIKLRYKQISKLNCTSDDDMGDVKYKNNDNFKGYTRRVAG